jgi:hypothetical protein
VTSKPAEPETKPAPAVKKNGDAKQAPTERKDEGKAADRK